MKVYYRITTRHDEKSLTALSHMQYDLFCQKNLFFRTAIAVILVVVAMKYIENWWAYLLIAYAGFLLTGKYNSANHTARKIIANIKNSNMPFPGSVFEFTSTGVTIIPDPKKSDEDIVKLGYKSFYRLGEDINNLYFFRNEYGGYVIPKEKLGEKKDEFKTFIQEKTGMKFMRRATAFNRVREFIYKRYNEPYHL